MQITVDAKGLDELIKKFDPKKIRKAIQVSLNRAAKSGKTEASSLLRERWNIKKSDFDRKMTFRGATYSNLQAVIKIIGEPISLIHFNPTQIAGGIKTFTKRNKSAMPGLAQKKSRGDTGGIRVQILRSKTTQLKKAFFILGKGGTPLIVRRSKQAKSQLGRKEGLWAVKVITQPSMFKQSNVLAPVKMKIINQFNKEWSNQVKQMNSGGADWLKE